ncbi:MAG: VOC family protein [Thermoplasmata archaeon]|nr:VOC family protein [Thermoplasmata archaeon]
MAPEAHVVSLIVVRNMDRAIKFYTKVLGAKLRERAPGPMKNFWASLKVGGAEVWFVSPPEREKRKLAYHAFLVKDIKRFVGKLKKHGVKFEKAEPMEKNAKIEGPIVFESFGASAMFKDSEGNLLMVWQSFGQM